MKILVLFLTNDDPAGENIYIITGWGEERRERPTDRKFYRDPYGPQCLEESSGQLVCQGQKTGGG